MRILERLRPQGEQHEGAERIPGFEQNIDARPLHEIAAEAVERMEEAAQSAHTITRGFLRGVIAKFKGMSGVPLTASELVALWDANGTGLSYGDVLSRPVRRAPNHSRWDQHYNLGVEITPTWKLRFPLLAAPMDTVNSIDAATVMHKFGAGTVFHRTFGPAEEGVWRANAVRNYRELAKKNIPSFSSVGLNTSFDDIQAIYDAGQRHFCIETPNMWMDRVMDFCRDFAKKFPDAHILIGNIADGDGAVEMARFLHNITSADTRILFRVGIGAGSACTTRLEAGTGVPQFTTNVEVVDALRRSGLLFRENGRGPLVIADGGIRDNGDLGKALAVADIVMIGGKLAGHDESPGDVITDQAGHKYKKFRGMSSFSAGAALNGEKDRSNIQAEGEEGVVPYRGSLERTLILMECALRSGMSYAGSYTLAELRKNARFNAMTQAGIGESKPAAFMKTEQPPVNLPQ